MALSTALCSQSSTFLVSKKGPKETITSSFASIFSNVNTLLAPPTRTEIHACRELCRLQRMRDRVPATWSLAMVYHAYPELTGMECITRAVIYSFLCIGIKCLIMTIDDILDYDIDANVERTKNRALPRGAIGIKRAWLFFALQVVIGVFLAYKSANFHVCVAVIRGVPDLQALDVLCTHPFGLDVQYRYLHGMGRSRT
ncbi:uncharacterized protein ARMOST_19129 [Armillaria ostoyae]|uniref:Uncharacterized protein n=1 Tax=Armillaria ostoyae TaxID=47428 RepID=A0A284S3S8_ARMOS|nr:uncharacterized protein ARMOST_19129 [Armillaria ostoyae]